MRALFVALTLIFAGPALAEDVAVPPDGQVTVSLAEYTALLAQLGKEPREAPAAYAIGQSSLAVTVSETEGRYAAAVERGLFSRIRGDVYMIAPPIVSSEETIDRIVEITAEATREVLG